MEEKTDNLLKTILQVFVALLRLFVTNIYWIFVNFKSGMSKNTTCLVGKTAIITGGNSGIGYMTSVLLASRGCKVIIACRRKAEKERDQIIKETNNPNVSFKHLDLCQFASVRKFAEQIKTEEKKIDILINNAGIGYSDDVPTVDGLDKIMQANFFGHFLLTHLLIDLMKASDDGRIVFLTSGLASMHNVRVKNFNFKSEIISSRYMSYCNSKACNIFIAEPMAKKLEKYGIKVNSADPGVAKTPIFDSFKGPESEQKQIRYILNVVTLLVATDLYKAAQTSFHLAASKEIGNGLNYFRCIPMPSISGQNNVVFCEEIWRESEKIVKLRPEEMLG